MTGPSDPFGGLADAAVQMHEMFVSLVAAGFTEAQAMQLLIAMVPKAGDST